MAAGQGEGRLEGLLITYVLVLFCLPIFSSNMAAPHTVIRGRGAVSNASGRYETAQRARNSQVAHALAPLCFRLALFDDLELRADPYRHHRECSASRNQREPTRRSLKSREGPSEWTSDP